MFKYDKLRGLETDENYFDFTCPFCNADGTKKRNFELKPLNISYKPEFMDNSDIKNVFIKKELDKLPTLRKALEQSINKDEDCSGILIICNVCNRAINTDEKKNPSDIKKWIKRNTTEYLELK